MVRIAHEVEDRLLDAGATGEVVISGPNVTPGYEGNPEANRKSFFMADGHRWFRTGDQGAFDEEGYLSLTGRLKEIINRGGENIAPREIDEVLLQHPAVLDAACVGVPDPNYGQEILACLVLKEGKECSLDQIRSFCLDKLGKYKTPKEFHFVHDLPRGPSGKVQRLKLVDWVG